MESSVGILFKGYPYFTGKFRKKQKDVLETYLLFRPTNVIRGETAAKIFYDKERFIRKGATPKRFKKTLLGEGGVQGLDHENHLHRKQMFMRVMAPESLEEIKTIFRNNWDKALGKWEKKKEIILFPEAENILFQTACQWAGVPLPKKTLKRTVNHFSKMIDGSGAIGPRHWKGRRARKKAEKWITKEILKLRKNPHSQPENSIFSFFSFFRDANGELLSPHVAAVEIINLIRPIVAIARYITFSAHALHQYPQYEERLRKDKDQLDLYFVQEVRRFYPFFPFVAAIVNKPFRWQKVVFPKNRRVLLDLYATNHDAKLWSNPDTFYAERFIDWDGSAFNFIPQGGGDHHKNHRCAGEWITIDLTRISIDFMVNRMCYEVVEQDLEINMSRIPAIPESRFKMANITRRI